MEKDFKFGDYAVVEQKRYGCPNEFYDYKVIGTLESNVWVDVPVQSPGIELVHLTVEPVVALICCGVQEREVRYYNIKDVMPKNKKSHHP